MVQSTTKALGMHDSKPLTGTTVTGEELKEHFAKVSKDRYEEDPAYLLSAVVRLEDRRSEQRFFDANK